MAFTFDQIFAVDPASPDQVASNGLVTIFTPGDPNKAPITIGTSSGLPLANPVRVNDKGFGPAFTHPTLDRVAWSAGDLTGFFTSYEGMKNVALAAQEAADEVLRMAKAGELGGGGSGGGGGVSNGDYWNRNQTVPVVTVGAAAPWPSSAPEGALIVRLTGTGA